jgi:hypothetical protein
MNNAEYYLENDVEASYLDALKERFNHSIDDV